MHVLKGQHCSSKQIEISRVICLILSGEGRYVPGSQASTTSVDSDPFTGQGRYIPGGGGITNGAAGGTDPFTGGGRYVPTYREEPKRKPVGAGDSRAADPITGNDTLYELMIFSHSSGVI